MAIGTAIAVGAQVLGGIIGGSGRSAQKRARRAQLRLQGLQRFQSRVQAARETAISRAEVVARAGNEGILDSSPVQGSLGAQASQYGAGVAFANAVERYGATINAAGEDAANAADRAGMVTQVGTLFGQAVNAADSLGYLDQAKGVLSSAGSNLFEAGQAAVGNAVSFFAPRAAASSFYTTAGR